MALEHNLKAKNIMDTLGIEYTSNYANIMSNIGFILNFLGEYEKALFYLDESIRINLEIGKEVESSYVKKIEILLTLANNYYSKSELDKALDSYYKIIKINELSDIIINFETELATIMLKPEDLRDIKNVSNIISYEDLIFVHQFFTFPKLKYFSYSKSYWEMIRC
jgi:tetratricopeptide (TPR) repeat protein